MCYPVAWGQSYSNFANEFLSRENAMSGRIKNFLQGEI